MAFWLLKTEPSEYSAVDLRRARTAAWDGVANATALKNLREMKKGDGVLIYHTAGERAIVATAEVIRPAYADPTSDDDAPSVVDIRFRTMLLKPVTLDQIKSDRAFEGWELVRIGRLSVVATPAPMWDRVMALSSAGGAK
jgi:predicted RNA-binding protein with PUA-like domain